MMASDPAAAILAKLQQGGFNPGPTGTDAWESRCPAHDGRRRNLSIKRGDDGRILVHCHHQPGCDPAAILAALGMTFSDLFPGDSLRGQTSRNGKPAKPKPDHRGPPSGNGKSAKRQPPRRAYPTPELALAKLIEKRGEPTTSWPYHDADGSESFRVYRFDWVEPDGTTAKEYRPVHTTPEGWVVGDPPGQLPLYRLPELARAGRVFVTEGEKTSELARHLGIDATTSSHGAKSAHKSDWSPLAGKDVVILPDRDPEGEDYAREVCAILAKLDPRPTVKIVRLADLWRSSQPLPEKGDIEQWLADGVSAQWTDIECRAELERHAVEAPEIDLDAAKSAVPSRRFVMRRAADIEPLAVEWLWEPRVPAGMVSMFAGDPKLGKSLVTIALAAAVSRGAPLPMDDRPRDPASVIIMSAEDDPARTIVPRLRSAGANLDKVYIFESVILDDGTEALPSLRSDMDRIQEATGSLGDCKLIIIDPITAYLLGIDDHRSVELRGVLSPLKRLAERHGIAVVLVTHANKAGGPNGKYRVQGSIAYVGACRANYLFVKDREDLTGHRVLMLDNGTNHADTVPTLAYRIEDRGDGPAVEWETEPVQITTEEALAAETEIGEDRTEAREVDRWLEATLADGPIESKAVLKSCKDAGFSADQARRAKRRLHVRTYKEGFAKEATRWMWALPERGATGDDGPKVARR